MVVQISPRCNLPLSRGWHNAIVLSILDYIYSVSNFWLITRFPRSVTAMFQMINTNCFFISKYNQIEYLIPDRGQQVFNLETKDLYPTEGSLKLSFNILLVVAESCVGSFECMTTREIQSIFKKINHKKTKKNCFLFPKCIYSNTKLYSNFTS